MEHQASKLTHNDIIIKKGNSTNPDFSALVMLLDRDLLERYGEQQAFFDQFNKVDTIKNKVVAYLNDRAVGCGAIKTFSEGVVEIKRMFVVKEHRGKGIAKKILAELENWAIELNSQKCILETGKSQPEAITFIRKLVIPLQKTTSLILVLRIVFVWKRYYLLTNLKTAVKVRK
ncbi:MAG TPA: GNAT family N-acetyltransferase [Pedobacter sp.]|jgi:GNAT superfamily N-acetyltransferase